MVMVSSYGVPITKFGCDWKPAIGQPNDEMNDEFVIATCKMIEIISEF